MAVHDQHTREAVPAQRRHDLHDDGPVRLLAERHRVGKGRKRRREPVRERRQDRHAQRLGGLDCDPLRERRVGREREVCVLLGRSERQDDAVVVLEIGLESHPVTVGDAHARRA
jgi:hypothetical protein